jgi:hypothetical protein
MVGVILLGPFRGLGLFIGVLAILCFQQWFEQRAIVNSPVAHELFKRGYAASLRFEYLQKRIVGFVESGHDASFLIAMKGWALPHGGVINIYVEIDSQRTLAKFQIDRKTTMLDQERTSHLVSAVESYLGDPRSAARFPVNDGFPCDLCVGFVPGKVVSTGECNLCDPVQSFPIFDLCHHLQELAGSLAEGDPTMLVGSCDKFGNITIRKM